MTLKVKCPTCEKEVEWREENTFRPFCSHRCKLIDLGEWASENRAIPVEENPVDDWNLEGGDTLQDPDKLH